MKRILKYLIQKSFSLDIKQRTRCNKKKDTQYIKFSRREIRHSIYDHINTKS